MNDIKLTRDADKMICILYKEYIDRCKKGMSKSSARCFYDGWQKTFFPIEHTDDLHMISLELINTLGCKSDIIGNFYLTDTAIIYMENRFPNGLSELLKYISMIIPLLPH